MVPLAAQMETGREVIYEEDATIALFCIVSKWSKMPPSLLQILFSDISFQVNEIGETSGTLLCPFCADSQAFTVTPSPGIAVKLRTALPAPSLQNAQAPLQRCLAERVQDGDGSGAKDTSESADIIFEVQRRCQASLGI